VPQVNSTWDFRVGVETNAGEATSLQGMKDEGWDHSVVAILPPSPFFVCISSTMPVVKVNNDIFLLFKRSP
jgi:predicted RNA-binding protein with EMAP domain